MNHNFVNCHCTWHCMHVAVTEEVGTLPPLILESRDLHFCQVIVSSSKSCSSLLTSSSFHPLKTKLQMKCMQFMEAHLSFSNTSNF